MGLRWRQQEGGYGRLVARSTSERRPYGRSVCKEARGEEGSSGEECKATTTKRGRGRSCNHVRQKGYQRVQKGRIAGGYRCCQNCYCKLGQARSRASKEEEKDWHHQKVEKIIIIIIIVAIDHCQHHIFSPFCVFSFVFIFYTCTSFTHIKSIVIVVSCLKRKRFNDRKRKDKTHCFLLVTKGELVYIIVRFSSLLCTDRIHLHCGVNNKFHGRQV